MNLVANPRLRRSTVFPFHETTSISAPRLLHYRLHHRHHRVHQSKEEEVEEEEEAEDVLVVQGTGRPFQVRYKIDSKNTLHNTQYIIGESWQEVDASSNQEPAPLPHSTQAGPRLPTGTRDSPLDCFRLFFTDEFFDLMISETNRCKWNRKYYHHCDKY